MRDIARKMENERDARSRRWISPSDSTVDRCVLRKRGLVGEIPSCDLGGRGKLAATRSR